MSSARPPLFRRSLWQETQYRLMTSRCAAAGTGGLEGDCWASNVNTKSPAANRLAKQPTIDTVRTLNIRVPTDHTRQICHIQHHIARACLVRSCDCSGRSGAASYCQPRILMEVL